MVINILKRYSYKWQPKVFKLVLNFPSNGPPKIIFFFFFFWYFLNFDFPIFSSALCYCTAELLSSRGRRPSSSVDIVFSDTTERINATFWGQVPIHHIFRSCLFFKFFFSFFFVYANMGPYGRKKLQTTSYLKVHEIFSQKFRYNPPRNGLYQSCINKLWNFKIWIFGNFVLFFFGGGGVV